MILQPLQPFADALRRDGERAGELRQRRARVGFQQRDQADVALVEARSSVSLEFPHMLPPIQRQIARSLAVNRRCQASICLRSCSA